MSSWTDELDGLSVMAFDPGVEGGWALFPRKADQPLVAGTYGGKGKTWEQRLDSAMGRVDWAIASYDPEVVVIEYPAYFSDNGRGSQVAAKGDLVKLSICVGRMWELANKHGKDVRTAPVVQWRGQMSDALLERRVRKILGDDKCRELGLKTHAWDAAGIGLWVRGSM